MSQWAKSSTPFAARPAAPASGQILRKRFQERAEHAVVALGALRIVALDVDHGAAGSRSPAPRRPIRISHGVIAHRLDHGHRRMRGRDRARQAKAGLGEQGGIFLHRALAAAAQHHHLQIEPAAGPGTVVGRQRRLEHQHARARAHGAPYIGENANAIGIVVIVHEMADQIEVAAFRRRRREHVAGDEAHRAAARPRRAWRRRSASAMSNSVARRFG